MYNNTGRFFLDVPYVEKNEAKELGAWWDPDKKKWYVPRGKSTRPFERWIPEEGDLRGAKRKVKI